MIATKSAFGARRKFTASVSALSAHAACPSHRLPVWKYPATNVTIPATIMKMGTCAHLSLVAYSSTVAARIMPSSDSPKSATPAASSAKDRFSVADRSRHQTLRWIRARVTLAEARTHAAIESHAMLLSETPILNPDELSGVEHWDLRWEEG